MCFCYKYSTNFLKIQCFKPRSAISFQCIDQDTSSLVGTPRTSFLEMHLSRIVGKPTICICETKAQISFAVTAKLISAFVFATRIEQFLFDLYPKIKASSYFLCLYSPVYVGPVWKPHCWFSHEAAHLITRCLMAT